MSEQKIRAWLARWGFAAVVGLAAVVASLVGSTVAMPSDLPAVALQAAPIYRLEVGMAVFAGLYIAALAIALACHNRGFTEIGTGGIRAESLARVPGALAAVEDSLAALRELLGEMKRRQELDRRG